MFKDQLTPQQKATIEYSRRLYKGEYVGPERLDGKTVFDVLDMPEYITNLAAYMNEQKMTRDAVLQQRKKIIEAGKFPAPENRPCIDRVIELGLMESANDFAFEFAKVLNRTSEHPQEIREYIRQLGMRAYQLTIEQFICDANPDMAELVKKSQETTKN